MPKNIYTVSINSNMSIDQKANAMEKALDTKYFYLHTDDLGDEILTRENYYLYGKKDYLDKGLSSDLYNLSKKNEYFKQKQARYILTELAKLNPRSEDILEALDTYSSFRGDEFTTQFFDIIEDAETDKRVISDDDINRIFAESENLSLKYDDFPIDEEALEEDKKLIEFNNPENKDRFAQADNLAAKNVIKAFGYDKESIDKALVTIKNATKENYDKVVEAEYKKLIDARLSKLPESDITEAKTIDEIDKLSTIFKNYGSSRTGNDLTKPLAKMMGKPEFTTFIKEKATTAALAKFLNTKAQDLRENNVIDRYNTRDRYIAELIRGVKYAQTMHANRSLFARFVDWFKPNGEYRTINKCINLLKDFGYTKEKLTETLNKTDGALEESTEDTAEKFAERFKNDYSALDTLPATLDKPLYAAIGEENTKKEFLDEIKVVANNYSDLTKENVANIDKYQNELNEVDFNDEEPENKKENVHVYEAYDDFNNDNDSSSEFSDDDLDKSFDDLDRDNLEM